MRLRVFMSLEDKTREKPLEFGKMVGIFRTDEQMHVDEPALRRRNI